MLIFFYSPFFTSLVQLARPDCGPGRRRGFRRGKPLLPLLHRPPQPLRLHVHAAAPSVPFPGNHATQCPPHPGEDPDRHQEQPVRAPAPVRLKLVLVVGKHRKQEFISTPVNSMLDFAKFIVFLNFDEKRRVQFLYILKFCRCALIGGACASVHEHFRVLTFHIVLSTCFIFFNVFISFLFWCFFFGCRN